MGELTTGALDDGKILWNLLSQISGKFVILTISET
jgi:hypothetical protein